MMSRTTTFRIFVCSALTLATAACDPGGGAGTPDAGNGAEPLDAADNGDELTVLTESGPVHGAIQGATRAFLGIPFAAPPVGELRWRPPQPAKPWASREATQRGPSCAQIPFGTDQLDPASSEDCLYLNIWVPTGGAGGPDSRPTMVWIHGGGFVLGSGGEPLYDGRALAEATGNVVVTINYRLGPFGFLALPALESEDPAHPTSGNYGIEDQRFALAWIRRNIGAFGGDADNVTLFGQSAGAISVCQHLLRPASADLFHRAIMESGNCEAAVSRSAAHEHGQRLVDTLGCAATDPVGCLRGRSALEIARALPSSTLSLAAGWGPVIDGQDLTDRPEVLLAQGRFHHVPVLLGSTRDEGTVFFLGASIPDQTAYEALIRTTFGQGFGDEILAAYPASDFASFSGAAAAVVGDALYVCQARRAARAFAAAGDPAFVYAFNYPFELPVYPDTGAFHGVELLFVFGNPYLGSGLSAAEEPLRDAIMGYWGRFAQSGDPNGGAALVWPKYEVDGDRHLNFDLETTTGASRNRELCDFWDAHPLPLP